MLIKQIITICLCSLSLALHAQSFSGGPGLVYLYLGGTMANFNTEAEFHISQEVLDYAPNVSTSINLEKDLNFPSNSAIVYAKALVGSRFQLAATYLSSHRSGGATLNKTFAFGEHSYTVSAPVRGFLNTDYFSASLRLSIIHNPMVTAGISFGGRYLKFAAGITADSMGYVFDKSGEMNVPVFVPGIHGSVYAIRRGLIRGSLEYFSLALNGTKGKVLEGQLSFEYYLLKYLGIGVGYSITHFEARELPDNPIYLKNIDYKVSGFQLFGALRF